MARHILRRARKLGFGLRRLVRQAGAVLSPAGLRASTVRLGGQDVKLYTHSKDLVLGAMFRGEAEFCRQHLAELEFLSQHVHSGTRVLDIGGNIGSVAIPLAKREPEAAIYCFEPVPLNFGLLCLNIDLNNVDNVLPVPAAAGSSEGPIRMFLASGNYGDHRSAHPGADTTLGRFAPAPHPVRCVNPANELLRLLGEAAPTAFDLVKIDTQGADMDILGVLEPHLARQATIVVEFSPYHLRLHGTSREEVAAVLDRFECVGFINPLGHERALEPVDVGAALAYYDAGTSAYAGYRDLVLRARVG